MHNSYGILGVPKGFGSHTHLTLLLTAHFASILGYLHSIPKSFLGRCLHGSGISNVLSASLSHFHAEASQNLLDTHFQVTFLKM